MVVEMGSVVVGLNQGLEHDLWSEDSVGKSGIGLAVAMVEIEVFAIVGTVDSIGVAVATVELESDSMVDFG